MVLESKLAGEIPQGTPRILLVDDDKSVIFSTSTILRVSGFAQVEYLTDSRDVMGFLGANNVDILILDLFMPHLSGEQLLPEIRRHHPNLPIVVMTASDEVEIAVFCMKNGAFDFLVKPVDENRFITTVNKALEVRNLRRQVDELKRSLLTGYLENESAFADIVTGSQKMRAIFQYMTSVASSSEPVMITGETGVGKELIAKSMHLASGRLGEMVSLNIAGLDDALFSDTLFGHRKGAFSGATKNRQGMIRRAQGGTLFLDEVGDLDPQSQVKLLRLLQERIYYPLGADVPLVSDAHILCATNQNLRKLMEDGRFRADLYFRLSVHEIVVPPLRERSEDIPLLTNHFLELAANSLNKPQPTPPPELYTLLASYHFPGNIRELRSMIFDGVARHKSGVLSMERFRHLIHERRGAGSPNSHSAVVAEGEESGYIFPGVLPTFKEVEGILLKEALLRAKGNQGIAAGFLGISRQALNQRLRKKKL
ncbi:MAG: sigma-54-dependent Fis family transcriptional regulator [Magnetococcales bacterium]|nr:sigma-54-dependent Fis family transcriptional regulator [Magnetococcales bacterium]